MRLFSWKSLLPLLFLIVGVVGFALLVSTKPRAIPIEPSEQAWLVEVEPVQVRTLSPQLVLYGRVESPQTATLAAAVNADVNEVQTLEGMTVQEGELLIQLDDRDARLVLAQREAELAEIEAEIESEKHRYQTDLQTLENEKKLLELSRRSVGRMEQLSTNRVASESGLEEAQQARERQAIALKARQLSIRDHGTRLARLEARRERARALRDQAQVDLERTQIHAPFPARIAQVHVAEGERVRSGDPLIELYNGSSLEVRAQIPSRYQGSLYQALERGEPISAHAEMNGQTVVLQLDRFAGRVAQDSGGVDALFRIQSGQESLRLGSFVNLTLDLPAAPDVVAIPYEALYGIDRAYKWLAGRMRSVPLDRVGEWTAPDGKRRVLVRSPDLAAGDLLIVTQLPNAVDGLRVKRAERSS